MPTMAASHTGTEPGRVAPLVKTAALLLICSVYVYADGSFTSGQPTMPFGPFRRRNIGTRADAP